MIGTDAETGNEYVDVWPERDEQGRLVSLEGIKPRPVPPGHRATTSGLAMLGRIHAGSKPPIHVPWRPFDGHFGPLDYLLCVPLYFAVLELFAHFS